MEVLTDLLFGKIALTKKLVSEAQLRECLMYQRIHRGTPLGDVLVQHGYLDAKGRDTILAEQSASAFSEVNTLFGGLVVRNGFATREQVDVTLQEQRARYAKDGAHTPHLGDLLVEKGVLTPADKAALLHRQQTLLRKNGPSKDAATKNAKAEGTNGKGKGSDRQSKVAVPKPGTVILSAATLTKQAQVRTPEWVPDDFELLDDEEWNLDKAFSHSVREPDLLVTRPQTRPEKDSFSAPPLAASRADAGDSLSIDFGDEEALELPTLALDDAFDAGAEADFSDGVPDTALDLPEEALDLDFLDAEAEPVDAPKLIDRSLLDPYNAPSLKLDDEDELSLGGLSRGKKAPEARTSAPAAAFSDDPPEEDFSEIDFEGSVEATGFDLDLGALALDGPEEAVALEAEAAVELADEITATNAPQRARTAHYALPSGASRAQTAEYALPADNEFEDLPSLAVDADEADFATPMADSSFDLRLDELPRVDAPLPPGGKTKASTSGSQATLIADLEDLDDLDGEDVDFDADAIVRIDDVDATQATAGGKVMIENRFGRLAVDHGFVTEDQVIEALEMQESLRGKGKELKLGAILTMKGSLTLDQVQRLLALQDDGTLQCGECESKYNVTGSAPGSEFHCAKCGAMLVVPAKLTQSAAAAPRPSSARAKSPTGSGSSPTIIFDAPAPPPAPGKAVSASAGSSAMTILFDDAGPHESDGGTVMKFAARPADSEALAGDSRPTQPVINIPRAQPASANHLGEYEIVRELGRGAMGVVYEGIQAGLGRRVAIKVLPANFSTNSKIIERFRREAAAVSKLNHPHIIPVYGMGEQEGTHYFAMEFVDGRSLEDFPGRDEIESERSVHWFIQAAQALAYAHKRKIIHRDIKPANLMVSGETDEVKVADFGLAREEESASMTKSGQIMGTPAYMSPEQARGSKGEVDHRTDQYSLGVTFYEIFTSVRAFPGEDIHEVIRSVLEHDPAPPRKVKPKLHRDLATIVEKCMEKEKEKRYQDCEALVADLQAYLAGEPIAARPISGVERVYRKLKKHAAVSAVAAVAMIAVGIVSWYFITQGIENQQRLDREFAETMRSGEASLKNGDATFRRYQQVVVDLQSGGASRDELDEESRPEALYELATATFDQAIEKFAAAAAIKKDDETARRESDEKARLCKAHRQEVVQSEDARKKSELETQVAQQAIEQVRSLMQEGIAQRDSARSQEFEEALSTLTDAQDKLMQAVGALPNHEKFRAECTALRDTLIQEASQVVVMRNEFTQRTQQAEIERRSRVTSDEGLKLLGEAKVEVDAGAKDMGRDLLTQALKRFDEAIMTYPENSQARRGKFDACMLYSGLALGAKDWGMAEYFVQLADTTDIDDPTCDARAQEIADQKSLHENFKKNMDRGYAGLERYDWAGAQRAFEAARSHARKSEDQAEAALGVQTAEFGERRAAAEKARDEAVKQDVHADWNAVVDLYQAALEKAVTPKDRTDIEAQLAFCAESKMGVLIELALGKLRGRDWARAKAFANEALDLDERHEDARRIYREASYQINTPKQTRYLSATTVKVGSTQSRDHNPPQSADRPAIYLAEFELTNAEYREFVDAGGYTGEKLWDAAAWKEKDRFVDVTGKPGPLGWVEGAFPAGHDRLPVAGISFAEAKAYARWRAERDGVPWRLPGEFEWESAAAWNGTDQRTYPWGDEWRIENGSFSLDAPVEVGKSRYDVAPEPVLCRDMAGNVSEWTTAADGSAGVIKGGSFGFRPQLVEGLARLSARVQPKDPWYRSTKTGFRLAQSINDPDPAATDRAAGSQVSERPTSEAR